MGLLGVLLLGWLTGLRGVMHALLVTIGATALVPFVIVLGAVALVAATSLASALLADAASLQRATGSANEGRWRRIYHAQLARQRQSPLAWGLAAGCALGTVGLWLVLTALVIPLETSTLGLLRLTQVRLSATPSDGPQPVVGSDEPLRQSAWNPKALEGPDEPVRDAFGHPITRQARDVAGAFTLRSLGLDGVPSRDDLCASGQTGSSPADAASGLPIVEDLLSDRLGWSARFAALDDARCP